MLNFEYNTDAIVVTVSHDPHVSFPHSSALFSASDDFCSHAEYGISYGRVGTRLAADGAPTDIFINRLLPCGNVVLRMSVVQCHLGSLAAHAMECVDILIARTYALWGCSKLIIYYTVFAAAMMVVSRLASF